MGQGGYAPRNGNGRSCLWQRERGKVKDGEVTLTLRPRFHRTRSVKLVRAIADLAGSESIQPAHVAEAIQYRPQRQN
ncbi:MAG TPA: hypothetical protein VI547_03205 [Anaerolineales bacterium]|nr:hypothetical protein [Anaerolineales bacterium]